METPRPPHAIVFPYPYQGHVTPTINLAIRLASSGFTVTFVQTHFIHHFISEAQKSPAAAGVDIFHEARKLGLDIRYETISDGFPVEFDRNWGGNFAEYWETMLRDFPGRVDEVVAKIMEASESEGSRAAFVLVADTNYTWSAVTAKKHKMVNVSFWTQPALVFLLCYHLDLLRENGHFRCIGNGADHITYIPGVESIRQRDLMCYLQDPDTIPTLTKIVANAFEQVKEADFILCNTVEELESECISTLNQDHPTYAVGPTNFYRDFTKSTIPNSFRSESDCTEWLKSKPCRSVLYISFGSIVKSNEQEIQELAHGLLLSPVNFVWVLRPDIGKNNISAGILPHGFENAIKDRGLIVPWCNQNAVLSNAATGGFLTHCGWNSVLESIFYGVPMICHPFRVDQPTNRKLVVDDWKIGIDLCDGKQVGREEVAAKIGKLMMGEESIRLREEMKKVTQKLHNSLHTDGSSNRNFNCFVGDIKAKLCGKNDDDKIHRF